MEDSLEDYIKVVRNTKEGTKKNKYEEDQEAIKRELITLQRKKECESRAVKIVEFLIEGKLRPEVFLRCLKHINQAYYQDVVEERAISKLCGYSLCGKRIPDMPKKQYFIDAKNNKVYDVTDRKNYCSNLCYKASLHIKQQIDNSPLWLRKLEDGPKYSLLPSTERGIPGEEVNQVIAVPSNSTEFTSVSAFAEVSLDELSEMEVKKGNRTKQKRRSTQKRQTLQSVDESDELSETSKQEENAKYDETKTNDNAKASRLGVGVIDKPVAATSFNNKVAQGSDSHSKRSTKKSNKSTAVKSSLKTNKSENLQDVLETIRKSVFEWITLETYIFLYGEAYVKELVEEKDLSERLNNLKIAESSAIQQKKYLEICRKLHLSQLAEDKFDQSVLGKQMKPPPDYKTLKVESKVMNLKVHSFYDGMAYELGAEGTDKSNETDRAKSEETENPLQEEGAPAVLPFVDLNSQTAIRRKVFLNSISNTVVMLAQTLNIPSQSTSEELRSLVKTFKLQAHNVVFRPALWNLIALILIKMLSIRNIRLKEQLETKPAETVFSVVLNQFPDGNTFMYDLFKHIEDIKWFLKQYFSEE